MDFVSESIHFNHPEEVLTLTFLIQHNTVLVSRFCESCGFKVVIHPLPTFSNIEELILSLLSM